MSRPPAGARWSTRCHGRGLWSGRSRRRSLWGAIAVLESDTELASAARIAAAVLFLELVWSLVILWSRVRRHLRQRNSRWTRYGELAVVGYFKVLLVLIATLISFAFSTWPGLLLALLVMWTSAPLCWWICCRRTSSVESLARLFAQRERDRLTTAIAEQERLVEQWSPPKPPVHADREQNTNAPQPGVELRFGRFRFRWVKAAQK